MMANPMTNTKNSIPPLDDRPKDNVLVVNNDADQLRAFSKWMPEHCHLYVARTAQEAISLLERTMDIRLVISDLALLTADNYSLLKHLKLNEVHCQIPIINLIRFSEDSGKFLTTSISVRDFSIRELETTEFITLVKELLSNEIQQQLEQTGAWITHLPHKIFSADEIKWLKQLENLVLSHISDPSYHIEQLAFDLHLSGSTLARRIVYFFRLNPSQYITRMRMQKAKYLLENKLCLTVLQVSSAVGFRDQGAFSRAFSRHFKVTPSELLK
jgi:AraC-like DNA-binding protein